MEKKGIEELLTQEILEWFTFGESTKLLLTTFFFEKR